jgi:hypothetical protein
MGYFWQWIFGIEYSEIDPITGTIKWFKRGKLHRKDGPAVICHPDSKWMGQIPFCEPDVRRERLDKHVADINKVKSHWHMWYLNGEKYYTLEDYIRHNPSLKTEGEKLMFYLRWK